MKPSRTLYKSRQNQGFTLVELLVVIAIITILAGLVLPALAKAKGKSYRASCLNNIKELQICWTSYAQDHEGMLPESYFFQATGAFNANAWVRGSVDDNPVFGQVDAGRLDSTNVNCLKQGTLWAYNSAPGVYRCPSDRSMTAGVPRVRSYSINSWMGGTALPGENNYRVFRKEADIVNPSPAQAAVFIDEHEKSINEGWFVIDMVDSRGFSDAPASRHDGSFTLSFADGHAEAWKLRDAASRTWVYLPTAPTGDSERLRLSASSAK